MERGYLDDILLINPTQSSIHNHFYTCWEREIMKKYLAIALTLINFTNPAKSANYQTEALELLTASIVGAIITVGTLEELFPSPGRRYLENQCELIELATVPIAFGAICGGLILSAAPNIGTEQRCIAVTLAAHGLISTTRKLASIAKALYHFEEVPYSDPYAYANLSHLGGLLGAGLVTASLGKQASSDTGKTILLAAGGTITGSYITKKLAKLLCAEPLYFCEHEDCNKSFLYKNSLEQHFLTHQT